MAILRRYFYSGWAFLIPYLAVYLLFYATKWPVNAAGADAGLGLEAIGKGSITDHPSPIPALLHVYWALHAIHAILAGFALWSWWRDQTTTLAIEDTELGHREPTPSTSVPISDNQWLKTGSENLTTDCTDKHGLENKHPEPTASPPHGLWPITLRLLPWLLLALLFYIPGVYLEWPSDPWEHLRRINEWRILDTVGAHSSWHKFAYFIPYSLLSWCIGLRQLFWLDFYYTGICLLLCWQYYRFSRACGLGERASMVFVIIQALLFGNNIFSFYRYYGISSSIYAQLGAIALTRIVLGFAASGTKLDPFLQEKKTGSENLTTDCTDRHGMEGDHTKNPDTPLASGIRHLVPPSTLLNPDAYIPNFARPCFWHLPSVFWLLAPCSLLLALTAFNHVQGIGIAALGIAAVLVWRLIEWRRSALWWLIAATLVINALFLWLYHRPAIIETYRSQGFLNAWYGFNLLDLGSPAGDRMLQIVSAFGLVNLAAGLFLLRRNHVIAWLTLTPLLLLLLPGIAIPFATVLSKHGDPVNIITFQRMLFAIPLGLALVCLGERLLSGLVAGRGDAARQPNHIPFLAVLCLTLVAFVALNPARPSYNRTWQTISRTPDDLQMRHLVAAASSPSLHLSPSPRLITTFGIGTPLQALGVPNVLYASRAIGLPASDFIIPSITATRSTPNDGTLAFAPAGYPLFTPRSLASLLSTHWPPQQVASDHAGSQELVAEALSRGGVKIATPGGSLYQFGPAKAP